MRRQSWTQPAVPRDPAMTKSLSQQADKLDEGFTKIAERRQEFDQQQKDVREQPVESVDVSSEVWFPPAGRAYHCSV